MPGAEPGSAKAALIAQFQREYEAALVSGMAPKAGRPTEKWQPNLVAGIDNTAESPFEGSNFVLTNMWQSAYINGRVTQVYAGVEGSEAKLRIVRLHVMNGLRESLVDVPLPAGAGVPRISAADGGILSISTASGRAFQFDIAQRSLLGSK